MTSFKDAEAALDAAFILPMKVDKDEYEVLQAVHVKVKDGICCFGSLSSGITKNLLETNNLEESIQSLTEAEQHLKTVHHLHPFSQNTHSLYDLRGSLTGTAQSLVSAKGRLGWKKKDDDVVALAGMQRTSIPDESRMRLLMESSITPFVWNCGAIKDVFKRKPTKFSGATEYGVGFVTKRITGQIYITESKAFNAVIAAGSAADIAGAEAQASAVHQNSKAMVGGGVLGLAVHFFHLYRSVESDDILVKDNYVVKSCKDKRLLALMGRIATKTYRRLVDPKRPPSQALILPEGYLSGATYAEQIEDLEGKADDCTYFTRTQAIDERQMAALRVVSPPEPDEAEDERKPSADEKCKVFFGRSYNMLLESTMSHLEAIDAAIREDGTANVQGYVVDGIKPVLPGKIVDSLPVIYDKNLSGTPESDDIPGWVLREPEGDEKIFTLCKVDGSDGDGIVSASNCIDWQVRESIVYVQKTEATTIEELKGEGFYQLSPSEDGPIEANDSAVKDGSVLMMGRHVLALKEFQEPGEGESQALPADEHAATTNTANAPNSVTEGFAIRPIVTNPTDVTVDAPSADLSQSRKKQKT